MPGGYKKQCNALYSEAGKQQKEENTKAEQARRTAAKTPTHMTDPFKGTNEKPYKLPFFQTESFRTKKKAEQRKAFFNKKAPENTLEEKCWEEWLSARKQEKNSGEKPWEKRGKVQDNIAFSKHNHESQDNAAEGKRGKDRATDKDLREGAVGRVPLGLTKNEVEADWRIRAQAREQHKKQKKTEKQRRYRNNKREKKRQANKGRRLIKIDKQRFFPRDRNKLRRRRRGRRREYRQFIAALTSELRKKEESKRLRKLRGLDRRAALSSKKEKKRIQKRVKASRQKLNKSWNEKWKKWIKEKHQDRWKNNVKWRKGQTRRTKWIWAKNSDRKTNEKSSKDVEKIKMHTKLRICINNERGINTIAKRQQLSKDWEQEKIDIAIMAETQKNTGGIEEGPSWGNEYITFFSTGISPKKREEQEKRRQTKWEK